MRHDMFKVIVERPRHGSRYAALYASARRPRHDDDVDGDASARESVKARHRRFRKGLNENLNPLQRWLEAQVGRPWDKVYAELCAGIDRRNTVQQHIHQHIDDFVARRVVTIAGVLHVAGTWREPRPLADQWRTTLYVDPGSGLLRANRLRERARRDYRTQRALARAALPRDRRDVDERRQLHRRDGVWYEVELATLRGGARDDGHPAFDVLRHRPVRIAGRVPAAGAVGGDHELYGREDVYAWRRRQLGARELRAHGLVNES